MNETGKNFEEFIYNKVKHNIKDSKNKIYLHKKYYSLDRQDYITVDISIEKYIDDKLFSIIVIECKDYKNSLPVDDVEEFHSKLQQIGADNTKGIIVTSEGKFQRSTINYAKSKGISLAYCNKYNDMIGGILYCKRRITLLDLIFRPILYIMYIVCRYKDNKYDFDYVIERINSKYMK